MLPARSLLLPALTAISAAITLTAVANVAHDWNTVGWLVALVVAWPSCCVGAFMLGRG